MHKTEVTLQACNRYNVVHCLIVGKENCVKMHSTIETYKTDAELLSDSTYVKGTAHD
jgi:hypothetical protein